MIFQGSARYPVDEIVVHCAATHPDWMRGQPLTAKRKEIDCWHREERGWRQIGYARAAAWILGADRWDEAT